MFYLQLGRGKYNVPTFLGERLSRKSFSGKFKGSSGKISFAPPKIARSTHAAIGIVNFFIFPRRHVRKYEPTFVALDQGSPNYDPRAKSGQWSHFIRLQRLSIIKNNIAYLRKIYLVECNKQSQYVGCPVLELWCNSLCDPRTGLQ